MLFSYMAWMMSMLQLKLESDYITFMMKFYIKSVDKRKRRKTMTANKERMYWNSNKEWWFYNEKTGKIELTEKAPPEAVESFKKWREPRKGKFLK